MLAGYRPAAEYAKWLGLGLAKPRAHLGTEKPDAPMAVGATEIGVSGRMSASEVRGYDFADCKQMRAPR
jgi:hypothetical protein